MEELIDVLNEDGTKTGKVVTRKEVQDMLSNNLVAERKPVYEVLIKHLK